MNTMKKMLSFLLIINCFSSFCFADETEFSEQARLRQYTGGADESDLKVQQVTENKKKVETDPEDEEGY